MNPPFIVFFFLSVGILKESFKVLHKLMAYAPTYNT